jgi:hypothetical protein
MIFLQYCLQFVFQMNIRSIVEGNEFEIIIESVADIAYHTITIGYLEFYFENHCETLEFRNQSDLHRLYINDTVLEHDECLEIEVSFPATFRVVVKELN